MDEIINKSNKLLSDLKNHHPYSAEHSLRVLIYARILRKEAQKHDYFKKHLSGLDSELLDAGASMHDIGKLRIGLNILDKDGKLTDEEFATVRKHPLYGKEILEQRGLSVIDEMAEYHQEKWNGYGYPKGVSGKDIPLEGQIGALADAYDARTSKRAYGFVLSHEDTFDILKKDAGIHFDPQLIRIFELVKDEFGNTLLWLQNAQESDILDYIKRGGLNNDSSNRENELDSR